MCRNVAEQARDEEIYSCNTQCIRWRIHKSTKGKLFKEVKGVGRLPLNVNTLCWVIRSYLLCVDTSHALAAGQENGASDKASEATWENMMRLGFSTKALCPKQHKLTLKQLLLLPSCIFFSDFIYHLYIEKIQFYITVLEWKKKNFLGWEKS